MFKALRIIGKILLMYFLYQLYLVLVIIWIDLPLDALILQNIAMIAAVFSIIFLFDRKRTWSLGLGVSGILEKSIHGMILGAVLISAVFFLILFGNGIKITGLMDFDLIQPFLIFVCVAISEEILIRGYIQGLLCHHYGKKISWLIPSILFAFMHGTNPNVWDYPFSMLNLFLAGYLLAIYRDGSNSLWGPIGFHLTWNFFQGCIYGFRTSGLVFPSILHLEPIAPPFFSGGNFGAEGSMITTVVLVFTIHWMLKKQYHWLKHG